MGAAAKREMRSWNPGYVETIGIEMDARIAIGRCNEDIDRITLLECSSSAPLGMGTNAREQGCRRLVTQSLLDGCGPKRGIGIELGLLFRMQKQEVHEIADQIGRRVMAGDDQIDSERQRLVLA